LEAATTAWISRAILSAALADPNLPWQQHPGVINPMPGGIILAPQGKVA